MVVVCPIVVATFAVVICFFVVVGGDVFGRDVFGVKVILVPYAPGRGSFYRVFYLPLVLSFSISSQFFLYHVCMFEAHMKATARSLASARVAAPLVGLRHLYPQCWLGHGSP